MGKLELAARARAAADDARTVSAAEGVAKKGGAKQDEPSGLDAIIAAAGDELRSSSGSADGPSSASPAGPQGGNLGASGVGSSKGGAGAGGVAVAVASRKEGKDTGGATRKSTREVVKTEKTKPAAQPTPGGQTGGGGAVAGSKRKQSGSAAGGKEADADADTEEVELEANGKPKLPRPTTPLSCPRCASEETKFCYYNNYNIKQPRYFCRGCQRYWTAGGMLRNVPVGAGRRKNKSCPGGKDEDDLSPVAQASRILASASAGDHGRQLSGLAQAAVAAAEVAAAYGGGLEKRERRDGSSDGSATEAEGGEDGYGRVPSCSGGGDVRRFAAPSGVAHLPGMRGGSSTISSGGGKDGSVAGIAMFPGQRGGSSREGSAEGGAQGSAQDYYAMSNFSGIGGFNPFVAMQHAAASAMQGAAGGWPGLTPEAIQGALAAQLGLMPGGDAVAQQHAAAAVGAQAFAAAQAAMMSRFNPYLNPYGAAAPAPPRADPGAISSSAPAPAMPSGPYKPTASSFSMPPHLQHQLTSGGAIGPAATSAATQAASPNSAAPVRPSVAAAASVGSGFTVPTTLGGAASLGGAATAVPPPHVFPPGAPAPAGAPPAGWADFMHMMAAMQQQAAAPSVPPQAATAPAPAGLSPAQMQQLASAISGGFNPFAMAVGAPGTVDPMAMAAGAAQMQAPGGVPAPGHNGSVLGGADAGSGGPGDSGSAPPSTAGVHEYRKAEDGRKRFDVSEDRAGHAG